MSIEKAKNLIDKNQIDEAKRILFSMENTRNVDVYYWLAKCYFDTNLYETVRYLNKILAIDPNHLNAIVLLHDTFGYGMITSDHAIELRNKIIKLTPGNRAFVYRSAGIECLRVGDYKQGFALYEHRLDIPEIQKHAVPMFPRWDGKASLKGKRILIRGEEGFGDNIQFCRYVQTLRLSGATVGYFGEKALLRLFEKTELFDKVYDNNFECPDQYDYEVMMYSLPHLLGTTVELIPTKQYLKVHDIDRRWKDPLSVVDGLKVGLVWSGDKRNNKNRSVNFEQLRPLFDADCHFFSLQKGAGKQEMLDWPAPRAVHDVMDHMKDFYDTACLIQELDIVIAVDTAIAHLAASLNKPVWLLHRYNGCWRWLLNRQDSPWYPSIKIYRQETPGNWNKVIYDIAQDLINLVNKM